MNILTERTEWSNWQLVILKFAMLVLGVFVGTLTNELWQGRLWILVVLYVLSSVVPTRTWVSQTWKKFAVRRG